MGVGQTEESKTMGTKRLVILASGGPAPGINSVIAAAVIEACNLGWDVLGSVGGYRGLVENDLIPLRLEEVRWIHYEGGAIIGMSRTCLLYTSPSPRDRQKSRMPSSA